jgi:hypothetical protein
LGTVDSDSFVELFGSKTHASRPCDLQELHEGEPPRPQRLVELAERHRGRRALRAEAARKRRTARGELEHELGRLVALARAAAAEDGLVVLFEEVAEHGERVAARDEVRRRRRVGHDLHALLRLQGADHLHRARRVLGVLLE